MNYRRIFESKPANLFLCLCDALALPLDTKKVQPTGYLPAISTRNRPL